MLFKALALLTLGIGNTLAIPSFVIKPQISPNVYRSVSTFEEMKNGDYSLNGKGSVSEELTSYGYDLNSYALKNNESKGLMFAEDFENNNLYFYFYNPTGKKDFDRLSFAVDYLPNSSTSLVEKTDDQYNFIDYKISLNSYNSTGLFQKYKVEDFSLVNSKHIYVTREIFKDSEKTDLSKIVGLGMQFIVDPVSNKNQVIDKSIINITDKVVAYETAINTNADKNVELIQSNYCLFNTSIELDDLLSVSVIYDYRYFYGYSDIAYSNTATDFTNKNLKDHMDSTHNRFSSSYTKSDVIVPETKTYTTSNWSWFKTTTYNWEYSTISRTSNLKNPISNSVDLSKYTWCVRFNNQACMLSRGLALVGFTGNYFIGMDGGPLGSGSHLPVGLDFTNFDKIKVDYNDCPIDVSNFSILQLTYRKDGKVLNSIAVDTYTDSKGNSPISEPDVTVDLNIIKFLKQFFFWLMNNWWAWVIIGILLLPVAYPVVKIVWFLLKIIAYIISLPFKLLIHLFGGD